MTIKTAILGAIIIPVLVLGAAIDALKQPYTKAGEAMLGTQITTSVEGERLNREKILKSFFAKNKSPLVDHVATFLAISDKYDLDYRLLPAISCVESSCGKNLIEGSFNPFGWGIYGNLVTRFASYDEAIGVVGAGLHKNYISRGLDTPEKIEPVYTPPSKGSWRRGVRFFMGQMDSIAEANL